jgi:hypothetical protein
MGGVMDVIKGGYHMGKGILKLSSGTVITATIADTIRNMYFNAKNSKEKIGKALDLTAKDVGDVIKKITGLDEKYKYKGFLKKNIGGMAYARKKNMGLKMNAGGSVKSKKKSRGTGAAIKGTKFKGIF